MDVNKLFFKVMASDEVKDIPIIYIMAVFNSVLEAISSGECFYSTEIE